MMHDRERAFRQWAKENDPTPYRTKRNVGDAERWLSALGGGALAAVGLSRRTWGGLAMAALGGVLIYRGVSGSCPAYRALGVSTAKERDDATIDLSQHRGMRVEESVHVNASPEELYHFWRRFENLPRIMRHLKSVKTLPNGTSRWVAKGPMGTDVTWDAEIVGDEPGKLISWRSLPHSSVQNAGAVRFEREGDGTRIHVSLTFNPPAGKAGAAVAKLLGDDPAKQIREDLENLKTRIEREGLDRLVTEASEESFPASDPPSFSRGTATEKK